MLFVQSTTGKYEVVITSSHGTQRFLVNKDRECTCGDVDCPHVRAVEAFLLSGGKRAQTLTGEEDSEKSTCPVCAHERTLVGRMWRCSYGGFVCYFQWLDEVVHGGRVSKWHKERRGDILRLYQ